MMNQSVGSKISNQTSELLPEKYMSCQRYTVRNYEEVKTLLVASSDSLQ